MKVLLPEARPSLVVGSAIAITTILGYTAMAGLSAAAASAPSQSTTVTIVIRRYDAGDRADFGRDCPALQEIGMKLAKIGDRRIK